MQTKKLGSLDLTVVGIGCNNFGRELNLEATRAVVDAALDHGINFFDTADSYGSPKTSSETLLGEILHPHRNRIVLATKFGRILDDRRSGARASYVREATEASLLRLRTDRIDLMQLHIPDPTTPITETLGALATLIGEGKIREIGCSNVSRTELEAMNAAALDAGLRPFASVQDEFSLLCRERGEELLTVCKQTGQSFVPFRPLFNGLLTGKYRSGVVPPSNSRIGSKDPVRRAEIMTPQNLAAIEGLTHFAEEQGRTILELAFAWLLSHRNIPSVIAGVSSPAQVSSNAKASQWELTSADVDGVQNILDANVAAVAA